MFCLRQIVPPTALKRISLRHPGSRVVYPQTPCKLEQEKQCCELRPSPRSPKSFQRLTNDNPAALAPASPKPSGSPHFNELEPGLSKRFGMFHSLFRSRPCFKLKLRSRVCCDAWRLAGLDSRSSEGPLELLVRESQNLQAPKEVKLSGRFLVLCNLLFDC